MLMESREGKSSVHSAALQGIKTKIPQSLRHDAGEVSSAVGMLRTAAVRQGHSPRTAAGAW